MSKPLPWWISLAKLMDPMDLSLATLMDLMDLSLVMTMDLGTKMVNKVLMLTRPAMVIVKVVLVFGSKP